MNQGHAESADVSVGFDFGSTVGIGTSRMVAPASVSATILV